MSTPVQSSGVVLQLSVDQVTWKTLVCLDGYSIESTTQTTTTDTFCGRFIGLGPVASQITGTGVCESTPLTTQCTQSDLRGWLASQVTVFVRANYPTGSSIGGQISNNASGFVTAVGEQMAVNNLVKFTFTILINGTLA